MKRKILSVVLGGLMLLAPMLAPAARAFDFSSMSAAERASFRNEVHAYLLENPEVLLEVVKELDARRSAQKQDDDASLLKTNAKDIYEDGFSYVGGNPDGDITLVEFSDYRCPYCRHAFPDVEKLLKTDGNIRLIYKEYPILGKDSLISSRFAIATLITAGPKAYAKVNKSLMKLRPKPSPAALEKIAHRFGLDAAAITAKMASSEVQKIIDANLALGQRLRISGTPSFILGDQFLRGYVPLKTMRQLVAEKRAVK